MIDETWIQESPAPTRRERRKQEFQERILGSAIQLFEAQGCDETTLEEICAAADVSRPTFYKYYASKKELIQALAEKLWISVAQEMTTKLTAEHAPCLEYIRSFVQLIRDELVKYGNLERELIRQSMINGPDDTNSVKMLRDLVGLMEDVYETGQDNGDLGDAYPIDFLAEITMGQITTVMMNWAIYDGYPVEERLNQLAELIPQILKLNQADK